MIKKKLEILFREKKNELSGTTSSKKELMEAYNKIAPKYGLVKTKPWKDFKSYFTEISEKFEVSMGGIVLDVGSGNGRNLVSLKKDNWEFIASDLSQILLKNLVELPKEKTHIINNDVLLTPLKDNSIDLILCIAVLHHLPSREEVEKAIEEMYSILKDEGMVIVSCWRKWKKDTRKQMIKDLFLAGIRKLNNKDWRHGDISLPWYNNKKEIIAERYYHLFSKKEMLKSVKRSEFTVLDFRIHGGNNNEDNFFLLLQKEKN